MMGRKPEIPAHEVSRIKEQINSGVSLERIAIAFNTKYETIRKINYGDRYSQIEPLTIKQSEIAEKRKARKEYVAQYANEVRQPPPIRPFDFTSMHHLFTKDGFLELDIIDNKREFDWWIKMIIDQPTFPKVKILIDIKDETVRKIALSLVDKRVAEINEHKVNTEYQLARTRLILHAVETGNYDNLPLDCLEELQRDLDNIRDKENDGPKLLQEHN